MNNIYLYNFFYNKNHLLIFLINENIYKNIYKIYLKKKSNYIVKYLNNKLIIKRLKSHYYFRLMLEFFLFNVCKIFIVRWVYLKYFFFLDSVFFFNIKSYNYLVRHYFEKYWLFLCLKNAFIYYSNKKLKFDLLEHLLLFDNNFNYYLIFFNNFLWDFYLLH